MAQLKDYVIVQPKSKIKAGEGLNEGEYKFFTSSNTQSKWLNQYQYDKPALIFGTGGMASVHFCDTPFSTSTDCIVMYAKDNFNLEYVYYYLESHMYILENGFKGVGLKHISKEYILSISIPEVDPPQQESLIATTRKVDEIIYARQNQLTKLDELVKSRFIELFGDPKSNPKGYTKKQLGETCKVITGNTPSRAVAEYYGDHIEWIKTDNIVSGLLNPTTATECLSEKGMTVSRTVESGVILMACIAGSVSSIGRVCVTNRKVAFNQQINAIVPYDYNILFLYAMLQISKEYLVDGINMALKGILSKSKLEEKTFFVPPIELQEQFAAFVEQTDKSKLAIQESLAKLETLKKSLMQQYFG